ncbi:2-oxoacid dehydrogenase acyltransferase [Stagonosporopsis vannaccii]|nr:2-oxoacid dehydrogenase acyltransferase [Stagonosporopsis vannaccii]
MAAAPKIKEPPKEGPPLVTPKILYSSPSSKLATPAVRHILKQARFNIGDVPGTGRSALFTKEDVQRYLSIKFDSLQDDANQSLDAKAMDSVSELTLIQRQMSQATTGSIAIPHFFSTVVADVTDLDLLRRRLRSRLASRADSRKLSPLPYIMKAHSTAFMEHKALKSLLDTQLNPDRPRLLTRGSHNMGIT